MIPTRWSSAFEILARRLHRLEEERRLLLERQSTLVAPGQRSEVPDGGVDEARRPRETGALAGDAECRESDADP